MTPAVKQLEAAGIDFELREYALDSGSRCYGLAAAEALEIAADRVFKTLLARLDGKRLVVGIVPASGMLDLKALARAAGGKKAEMAGRAEAERSSGYVVGGISPFGQRKRLPTVLDSSAMALPVIHVSGGRRGLELTISPRDLVKVLDAAVAAIKG